ncbi:ubiquinone biosynthesis regulatory protein kinase UbiB [Piscirickettsia salmonis]|uniref:ubiquinone biosynthesis regulatory protein kinase UbiB n=1 Tax=Piscirickettsia salmonis TaxID=1238 RepID=UPI0007C8E1AF|nr:putative protein kinase UbiB [Piscirickettsiaceae bacterium NZ-RLO1]
MKVRVWTRFWRIGWALVRYRIDEVVLAIPFLRPLQFLMYLNPWGWKKETRTRAERLRLCLESLGPVFIKFGQILSTRRDLLPDDIALELARLQDQVPPFPAAQARAVLEKSYKQPLSAIFAEFSDEPMASASIAQVHAARLPSGQEVVVKVLRPHLKRVLRKDIDLMYMLARLFERYWAASRRLRPIEVVAELERNLMDELDLMREAANTSQLRRNFKGEQTLKVPEIYWEYTRSNVIVMERIFGVPVADIEALKAHKVDLKRLSERGVEIFFTQVFRDCFFHADMHPGNIFVDCNYPADPGYIAVDCGIVGTLSRDDQHYLAGNFLAFFKRDYRRVAELHVESGWVPAQTRVDEFESAIRTVCEPIFERPLKDISFGQTLLRLFQTARRFDMQVQPQLLLLQKTLLNIEGLGRQLNPELDLWSTAKPFLEKWMKEQVGIKGFTQRLLHNLPSWSEQFPEFPALAHQWFINQHEYHLKLKKAAELKEEHLWQLKHAKRSSAGLVIGIALLLLGGLFLEVPHWRHVLEWLDQHAWAFVSVGAGAVLWSCYYLRRN